MNKQGKSKLEEDYAYLHILLDFYVKNRALITRMSDAEYKDYIDDILDEINRIKKILKDNGGNPSKK